MPGRFSMKNHGPFLKLVLAAILNIFLQFCPENEGLQGSVSSVQFNFISILLLTVGIVTKQFLRKSGTGFIFGSIMSKPEATMAMNNIENMRKKC